MLDTNEILEKFIEKNKSVRTAFISSMDGFVIDGAVSSVNTDIDSLSADIMPRINDIINLSDDFKFGLLKIAMLEYKKGLLLISIVDEDIVLVLTSKGERSLGSLRIKVRKLIEDIKESL